MKTSTEQMHASQVFCPNLECRARGQAGQGNIVSHGCKRPRYRCKTCGKTFSAKEGTLFAGLRKPTEVIVTVVTLLAYGCPVQAIVHAFGLDERTVARWRDRAGAHCEQVHHAVVEQADLDLMHVQADEIRVKGRGMIIWMGLALMVSTRLWLAGVVSVHRDRRLADRLLQQVRACLQVWPHLCIATVIKRTQKKRVVEVIRKMTLGTLQQANALLQASLGGTMLNTAFIERLNGTMRERLATLTRKCRHAAARLTALHTGMYLLGCTYNFCWPHHQLSRTTHDEVTGKRARQACTPAMASGLTDHIWSVFELMSYKVAPLPWTAPKRRGRPRTRPEPDPARPKQSRGRPRKIASDSSTS
jgi:transposase-like protein